jgi:hypothetical protein
MQSKLRCLQRAIAISMSVLMMSMGASALAQNATGAIKGTVKDQNDAVVTKAEVTATNKATGAMRKIKSGSEGNFVFENLQPGAYEIKVEAEGFKTQTQSISVEVGNTTTSDFSMDVGTTSEVVDVTPDAPIINTTDTVVGGVINRQRVESLPLNGRSFLSIALLEPGVNVTYNANSGAGNPNNFFQISVGSAPQQMTLISVDGARVNDRITGGTSQNFSAETVQEFQISTLGFDLSSGTVSAGAINIVSRTGGNEFHGSGFFFYRDHNLSAFPGFKRPDDPTAFNPLCADPALCDRLKDPFFVRKQYGGTFGGPIKKDRLFFFANYERNDQVGARTINFSDPVLFGFNHIAQQPLEGDLFGVRLDYTVNNKHTAFLRTNIDSNDSISGTNLESTWIASSNFSYQTQMGLTSVLTSKLVNDFRFAYSYFRNRLRPPTQQECERVSGDPSLCFGLGGPLISFFGGLQVGTNVNVSQDRHPRTFQWTDNVNWTKGTHRIRFGGNYEYSYGHGTWNRQAAGGFSAFSPTQVAANAALFAALPASLKIPTGQPVPFEDLLQLPLNGTLTIGIGDPGQPAPYQYGKATSNHHIRFYGQDAWQIFRGFTLNYGLGWSYESNVFYHDIDLKTDYLRPLLGDNLDGPKQQYKNFDPAVGFAWALGKDEKTVIRASASLHHISPNVGFFNLNQRILFGPAGNGLQALSGTALQNPESTTRCGSVAANPAAGCLTFTTPTAFSLLDMLNYLPTAGAELRAFYGQFNGQDLSLRGVNIAKTVAGAGNLDAIYNSDSARTPYTIHIDVGVQREIMRNLSVSVDFVQRRGVGFGAFELFFPDLNRWNRFSYETILPSGTAIPIRNPVIPACTAANRFDPNAQCSLGPIQYGLPGILSRYSALQLKVDKRFSDGFTLGASYALSRYWTFTSISSNDGFHEGHGISPNNPRHRFTANAIWELPKYKGGNRFLRGALNDWQVSTIIEMRTGSPTSVTLGIFDPEGDGTFVFRLPGTTVSSFGYDLNEGDIRRLVAEYNANFPAPKDTFVRDIRNRANRDALGTPYPFIVLPDEFAPDDSFMSHDIRLTRTIRIKENVRLSLIGEVFNVFNIANLTGFSGTLDAYIRPTPPSAANPLGTPGRNPNFNFGQPTGRVNPVFGSGGPRAFQLAARVSF